MAGVHEQLLWDPQQPHTPPPPPPPIRPPSFIPSGITHQPFLGRGSNPGGEYAASVKVLGGGQAVLPAVVAFTGIVTVQPVGRLRGEKGRRGAEGRRRRARG